MIKRLLIVFHGIAFLAIGGICGAEEANRTLAEQAAIDQLLAENQLRVRVFIDKPTPFLVSQTLPLKVQILTKLSFFKGTKVHNFTLADIVLYRRMKSARSKRIEVDGESWLSQTWRFDLYANQAGYFQVPSIKIDASIYLGKGESIAGSFYSQPYGFDAVFPPEYTSKPNAFVGEETQLVQRLTLIRQGASEPSALDEMTGLPVFNPGDTLTREIQLTTRNSVAMLLPELVTGEISGLEHYPDSPELINDYSDELNTATRIEKHAYLLTSSGRHVLPAIDVWAYEALADEWRHLHLPEVPIRVSGINWVSYLHYLAVFMVVGLAGWMVRSVYVHWVAKHKARIISIFSVSFWVRKWRKLPDRLNF